MYSIHLSDLLEMVCSDLITDFPSICLIVVQQIFHSVQDVFWTAVRYIDFLLLLQQQQSTTQSGDLNCIPFDLCCMHKGTSLSVLFFSFKLVIIKSKKLLYFVFTKLQRPHFWAWKNGSMVLPFSLPPRQME